MLYFSAKESNLEVTQFLIDNHGANVDEGLEIAAQHSNIVAAQFLINHYGANASAALEIAAQHDNMAALPFLINHYGANACVAIGIAVEMFPPNKLAIESLIMHLEQSDFEEAIEILGNHDLNQYVHMVENF